MNFFAEFLGLSLILGACKSTESLNSVRVVEQSRKERPAWVGLPIGLTDSTASLVLSHIVKARVIDLPLGLRQAEVSALSDSRLLIETSQLQQWRQDSEFSRLNPADRSAVVGQLHKLLDQQINKSSISDIYFEKISDPTELTSLQDTYSIHVLVQRSQSDHQTMLQNLRNFCRSSQETGLIRLSQRDQVFSVQSK